MPQSKDAIKLLGDMEKLMWWIDYGRYAKPKKVTIQTVKTITAKELLDA